jgi:23S rRNA (guanosine2251-2'-O)-methyltransferase
VEGRAAVRQLLLSGARPVHEVWLAEGTDDAGIVELAAAAGVAVRTVRPDVLEATARSGLAEGVIARAAPLPSVALDELAVEDEPTTIIALDGGMEPSQLGGLLRSAGSFGVDGVVLGGQAPEPSSPVVSATAEGAVEEVPIVAVDDLASEIGHLAEQGSVVVGVERHGASTLLEVDLDLEDSAVVLVLDGAGVLGDQVRARCDAIVGVERSAEQGDDPQTLARLACLDLTRRRLPVEA